MRGAFPVSAGRRFRSVCFEREDLALRLDGCGGARWRRESAVFPERTIAREGKVLLIWIHVETKELKKRLRDVVEPGRDLGHVDGKRKESGEKGLSSTEESVKPAQVGSEAPSEKDKSASSTCESCS